jgi:hypothetical protein
VTFSTFSPVSFANADTAINVSATYQALKGNTTSSTSGQVGTLTSDLYTLFGSSVTAAQVTTTINPVFTAITTQTLSTIAGPGVGTPGTYSGSVINDMNNQKWFRFNASGNGFSIQDTQISDVARVYNYNGSFGGTNGGGVVNGLIGGDNGLAGNAVFGSVTGNYFKNIAITMNQTVDWDYNYLAGGGVIGLRSTEASVTASAFSGNIFDSIKVLTAYTNAGDTAPYIEGGGIIGLNSVSSPGPYQGSVTLAELNNNFFTNLSVISGDFLMGGGIVGLNNNSQKNDDRTTATLTEAINNVFGRGDKNLANGGILVQSTFAFRGGGIIGINGLSNADVLLGDLRGNFFGGITINAGTYLRGGGIVGLQTNDVGEDSGLNPCTPGVCSLGAFISMAQENVFYNIEVNTGTVKPQTIPGYDGGDIVGGGIIGVRSKAGNAGIYEVRGNIFHTIDIHTIATAGGHSNPNQDGNVQGGGIVGVSSSASGSMLTVSSNVFETVKLTIEGEIIGGGVIGIDAATTTNSVASIGTISRNTFSNIDAKDVTGSITGGGLVGARTSIASGTSGITNFTDNIFSNNIDISSGEFIQGGGLIGFAGTSGGGYVNIYNFANNNLTGTINVTAETYIQGGGILGAYTANGRANISDLKDSEFANIHVAAGSYLHSGGIIGTYSETGISYIDTIDNLNFHDIVVEAGTYIQGGGVIGTFSGAGKSNIDVILNSSFHDLKITAGTYIDGGGIIGVTGTTGSSLSVGISKISNSSFTNNTITAENGQIMGGIIYTYGLATPLVIENSVFEGNNYYADISDENAYHVDSRNFDVYVYGTVTIDTGLPKNDQSNPSNVVRLTATAGETTRFANNKINDDVGTYGISLYFGNVIDTQTGVDIVRSYDNPESDARLEIVAEGTVDLNNPIMVNQLDTESPYAHRTFQMDVLEGAGQFNWGGQNVIAVGTYDSNTHYANNSITLHANSTTQLLHQMTLIALAYENARDPADMALDVDAGTLFQLEPGARLIISGNGPLPFVTANLLAVQNIQLHGTLHFLVDPTPENISNESVFLLEFDPGLMNSAATIEGATVEIADFAFDPFIQPGQMYYLIDSGANGNLRGDPANDTYTVAVTTSSFKKYEFIIDKDTSSDETNSETSNRYLVARLVRSTPTPQPRVILDGVTAGLAYMTHVTGWLADHSYQQADLAIRQDDTWEFFSGFDVSYFTVKSHGDLDIYGVTYLAGFGHKNTHSVGSFLIGGFIEGGYSRYDVEGEYNAVGQPEIGASGHIRYLGIGFMLRERFNNGLRLEASLRGGQLNNRFRSNNFQTGGVDVGFNYDTPQYAVHFGVGLDKALNEVTSLDLVARYYWSRQLGKNVSLTTGETLRLEDLDSHMVRGGGRLTRDITNKFSIYGGGYFEYEFDSSVMAIDPISEFEFVNPELKGGTGVFEIGAISHANNNDRLSVEFGIQGYTGKFRGLSGGVRVGYEF